MKPGDILTPRTIDVRAAPMRVMARIVRDPNPIHLDPDATRAAGLGGRVINQGPANLGYLIDLLAAALPGFWIVRLDSRFIANVRAGDRVEAGGTISDVAGDRVTIDLSLRILDGPVAVAATAIVQRRAPG